MKNGQDLVLFLLKKHGGMTIHELTALGCGRTAWHSVHRLIKWGLVRENERKRGKLKVFEMVKRE